MQDKELLFELLNAESEEDVFAALDKRSLLSLESRWRYLGNMPNNQSIVHAQQSSSTAALVEKFTNGLDAILLKKCKGANVDPRGLAAPANMTKAIEQYFGEIENPRVVAEQNLVLYATGSKLRPCLSLYDAGEGQLANNFPSTFCSLISGTNDGSYKGAIPFVQGRFNMGGTGVLPFCSDKYKFQLILSRVPPELMDGGNHEWAYTIFCFFADKQKPSWKYLIGEDGVVLTAGIDAIGLLPKAQAKSGEICIPREQEVPSGTLIKMYDYKAPRSNICGELFKKLEEYLLRPALPLRLIECRGAYKANVMAVTVWDRFTAWESKLEEGFEEGASVSIKLESGETIPAEIRVFKAIKGAADDENQQQTGLRALINGQSHAKRDTNFFRTKAIDKEHIAGSLLVTLDCTDLGQDTRNALFMSNRENFREDPLLNELIKKLQKELRDHEGLVALNLKRYEEKIKNAVDDEQGVTALEELLQTDPELAELFGSTNSGKVAAKMARDGSGEKIVGSDLPFKGLEFPTYIHRADKSTSVHAEVSRGSSSRISFRTDVKNNYFSRKKHRGKCTYVGDFEPNFHLFNGVLTFTCYVDKNTPVGKEMSTRIKVTDSHGSGPFDVLIFLTVNVEKDVVQKEKSEPIVKTPKANAGPSRPDIKEIDNDPEDPPLTIESVPGSERLQLVLNRNSKLLVDAKKLRSKEESAAVTFVFKYGLALTALGLLDAAKKTPEWANDSTQCRKRIEESARGIARVIVPLCLSLPKSIPKAKT